VRFEIQKGSLNSKLRRKKIVRKKKYVHIPKIFVIQTLLIPRKICGKFVRTEGASVYFDYRPNQFLSLIFLHTKSIQPNIQLKFEKEQRNIKKTHTSNHLKVFIYSESLRLKLMASSNMKT
jgi:hypothetical protein